MPSDMEWGLEPDRGTEWGLEDCDFDVELRMSEFDARLHEVEAANLKQNSTWFAKFQAMEAGISTLTRQLQEAAQKDDTQRLDLVKLQASAVQLSETCAEDKRQLQSSIEQRYKKCAERIEECAAGCRGDRTQSEQHARNQEMQAQRMAVVESQLAQHRAEQPGLEQRIRNERAGYEEQCSKQLLDAVERGEGFQRELEALKKSQLETDKSIAKQTSASQSRLNQIEHSLKTKADRSELKALSNAFETFKSQNEATILSLIEAAMKRLPKETPKAPSTRFPLVVTKHPACVNSDAEPRSARRGSLPESAPVPRVKHTAMY